MKRRRPPTDGLVLAMDIGTSSLRTALFSLDGARCEATTSQHTYPLRTDASGAAELDPTDLLAAATRALTDTLERQEGDPRLETLPIVGWGTSCFWHSLLGLDKNLAPMTPVFTWADTRCSADAARLRADFKETETHARTGCMLRASFWPAKLAWLRRTERALTRRVAHWVSPVDYLHAQFSGCLQPSLSMTSGSGLVDLGAQTWDAELTGALGFHPDYAPGFGSAKPLTISGKYARKFRPLRETPILPAIGDGAAGNLGSGATLRRIAAINYGTSAAARVVRTGEYRPAPFGIFCYAISEGRWLLGGATSNAGNAFQWASDVFRFGIDEKTLAEAYARNPTPVEGLVALPFLNGERAPTWCEDVPSAMIGMRQSHTAADLHRAFTDATFLRLAQIVEPLELAAGGGRLRFIVSGGISHSRTSVRRLVNALGRTCQVSDEAEASLRGAAVVALESIGAKIAPAEWSRALYPDTEQSKQYARARERQTRLEEGLRGLLERPDA